LDGMTATLHSQGVNAAEATRQAYARMEFMVQQQAAALAFTDVVSGLALVVLILTPLAFVMKKPPKGAPRTEAAPH
jgi:hypothetical protein